MTQSNHEYECPKHGRFDKAVPFGESPPKLVPCPKCRLISVWMPPTVGVIWGKGFK